MPAFRDDDDLPPTNEPPTDGGAHVELAEIEEMLRRFSGFCLDLASRVRRVRSMPLPTSGAQTTPFHHPRLVRPGDTSDREGGAGWVREGRLARGWTQTDLAKRVKSNATTISQIETGTQLPGRWEAAIRKAFAADKPKPQ